MSYPALKSSFEKYSFGPQEAIPLFKRETREVYNTTRSERCARLSVQSMGKHFDFTRRIHVHLDVIEDGCPSVDLTHNHCRALFVQSKIHGRINRHGSAQLDLVVDNIRTQEERVHGIHILKTHLVRSVILLASHDPLQVQSRCTLRLVLAQGMAILTLVQCEERLFVGTLVRQERFNMAVERRHFGLIEASHLWSCALFEFAFSSHMAARNSVSMRKTQSSPKTTFGAKESSSSFSTGPRIGSKRYRSKKFSSKSQNEPHSQGNFFPAVDV
jgi:hypothetical protein